MGSWGIGPFESDGAADLEAAVVGNLVATLERFVELTRLRAGSNREAHMRAVNDGAPGVDKARAAMAILRLLLRNGLGSRPELADVRRWAEAVDAWMTPAMFEPHSEQAVQRLVKRELDELEALSSIETAASPTAATWPLPLSSLERMLLDHDAPSDLVAWAAGIETADEAWRACRVAEWLPHLAELRGVALASLVDVIARLVAGRPSEEHDRYESWLHGRNNRLHPGPSWQACSLVLRALGRASCDAHPAREQWEAETSDRIRAALSQ